MAAAENILGRFASRSGRIVGKTAKVGAVGAAGAGLMFGGKMIKDALSGKPQAANSNNANDNSGGTTSPGSAAGGAGVRAFTPPSIDGSYKKINANLHGDLEAENLKVSVNQANSLSSINSILKNMLKFDVAKANYDVKAAKESSLERNVMTTPVSAPGQIGSSGGESGKGLGAMLAVAAAIGGVAMAIKAMTGRGVDGPDVRTPGANPTTGIGRVGQGVGDALLAGGFAGDARRAMASRGASAARNVSRPIASMATVANDNIRPVTRAAGAVARVAGVGSKAASFFRTLKATGLTRLPFVSVAFASIDPVMAYLDGGGNVTPEVKKQLVGAIAMILGGSGGVAVGSAIGGAVGSVVPGAGTLVGIIAGGIVGAAASLGAEFVAEQLYSLITGEITKTEFVNRVFRGAVSGITRLPAMAAGAVGGAALGGAGAVARMTRGARPTTTAVSRAATAAPAAGRAGGLTLAAPTVREGAVAAGAVAGLGAVAAVNRGATVGSPTPPTSLDPNLLPDKARMYAQNYLGRAISDPEWSALLRATFAESGHGAGGREDAMIMASILNRARQYGKWVGRPNARTRDFLSRGQTILAVLYAPSQFQAVTGTRANGHRPSANFVNGPSDRQLVRLLQAVVDFLWKVPTNQVSFSAASAKAYGPGTNIGHLHNLMRTNGSSQVGQSVFNTTMSDRAGQSLPPAQAISPAAGGSSGAAGGGLLSRFADAFGGAGRAVSLAVTGSASGDYEAMSGRSNAMSGGWIIPTSGTVSSRKGQRAAGNHQGIDIAAPAGTPIYASKAGTVTRAEFSRSYGNVVYIDHGDGVQSRYAHMSALGVRKGEQVEAGVQIGKVGNTGRSRGNHLHFEIRRNNTPVNPESMIPGLAAASVSAASRPTNGGQVRAAGGTGGSITGANSPSTRTNAINNAAVSAARRGTNVTVQQASASPSSGAAIQTAATDTGAPESVASPVSIQMAYTTHWGANV